ncbi:HupE/UreJ protein [Gillisia sp. Hel_I_86]|uniref:HupE/UreJ family protein n=1 Tax=Gillisia sp. Hel_I_86 TaxID=1249981 RepID=UPI00119AD4F4|nr:HupE/UreJ family protein [Gillisia sp. Hel_I_86]TVZ26114.1 HupE/UreJ protein [Gillisia sp. Hel_I_86]
MSEFWLYFRLGLEHVLDWMAYDHVLFLMVLVAAYSFSSWKRVLWLVSIFTIGHTLSLFLAVYDVAKVDASWVELLIVLTILFTAFYNIISAKKREHQRNINILYFSTAFFGIIHGLGFSRYFKMIFPDASKKFFPLIEFALGIEAAQIIVVLSVLIISFILQNMFRVTRRDWILVISAIVIGIILPLLKDTIQAIW